MAWTAWLFMLGRACMALFPVLSCLAYLVWSAYPGLPGMGCLAWTAWPVLNA
jgi:hypothetical protein